MSTKSGSLTQLVYRKLIDPLLNSSHTSAVNYIDDACNVLDVACGNGTLATLAGRKAKTVVGIDLDSGMLQSANDRLRIEEISNVKFIKMDATGLTGFSAREFDCSTVSMALHQFSPEDGLRVLKEMMRVSDRIVIVDYNYPMPIGIYRLFTYLIERIAGGEHYRNFKKYMDRGGVDALLKEAGLKSTEMVIRGKGILRISKVER